MPDARPPITPEQHAAMLAEAQRHQAEFDEWAQGVIAGTIRPEGVELDALRAGTRAGRLRLDEDERRNITADYTARQRVAWSVGYGDGRTRPAMTVAEYDAHRQRIADMIAAGRARAQQ